MEIADPYPIPPWTVPCRGSVSVPGSKSITNRALLVAALCAQPVCLQGALFSRDSRLLVENLRQLGFHVEASSSSATIAVAGQGGRIPAPSARLFVGNAGTVARFLTAFVCLHPDGRFRLDGDPEMRRRPMLGLINALRELGAAFHFDGEEGCFPFEVRTRGLRGGEWRVDASASSQMLSALMLVAPFAGSDVFIHAPEVRPAFVEVTAHLMRRFGAEVSGEPASGYHVRRGAPYTVSSRAFPVEPDATAASYFMMLPLATGGSLTIRGMRMDLIQGDVAFAGVLRHLGFTIDETSEGWTVRPPLSLSCQPRTFSFETFSDTFLTLAAAAPLLPCPVTISGIGHTRFQETDRIAAMTAGLAAAGAGVETARDSLVIRPFRKGPRPDGPPVVINTYKDHRVAMSFAVLGSRNRFGDGRPWLALADPLCCGKTFPGFFAELDNLYRNCHDK